MKPYRLQLVFFCFVSFTAFTQQRPTQLHLQKNGHVKKKLEPGADIMLWLPGNTYSGTISFMKTDTIFLDGKTIVPVNDIRKIRLARIKNRKPVNWEELAWVTFGVGLSTVGMALSKWESWSSAFIISSILGYSPYLLRKIKSLSFKKYSYRIGGRFRLRVWDLN